MSQETSAQIALTIDGCPRIELSGTIDVFLARELLDAAKRAALATGDVAVDCAKLERLDTSALQVLLALERTLGAQGRRTDVQGASDAVRAFFDFSGAGRMLLDPKPSPRTAALEAPTVAQPETAVRLDTDDALDSGWQSPADAADEPAVLDESQEADSNEDMLTTELCDGENE
jgi:ABC-type transporter Mla MlaB component